MTVTQLKAALEQVQERANDLERYLPLVSHDYIAVQLSEIARIAELTRDLIEMEGLQLLETPTPETRT